MSVNWDDLRFLLAVRRAGSLGAAARLLKVEPSTASRRIGSLEAALGAQLAARTPEGLVLNDAGQLAADLAETIDHGITELVGRVGGDDLKPEGIVRLSTTDSMALVLMRGLIPLREKHPKIQVDLVVSSAALDLARREADIALRLFRETNPNLVIRKLGDIGWSVFASKDYVERAGIRPGAELSLAGHAIVSFKEAASRSPGALWLASQIRPEQVVLTCDSVSSVLNAVRAGLGISALPCFVMEGQPTLVRLTPTVVAQSEAFAVIPPDHRATARIRLVIDALVALFERERSRLEGVGGHEDADQARPT